MRDAAPGQESALPYGTSAHASFTISYLPQGLWPEEGLPTGLATAGADGASNVCVARTSALLALTSAALPEGVPVLVLSLDFGVATADADAHPLCPGLRVCCW